MSSGQTVCVTGAGGYIASWLVRNLLLKGYTVRGTARNPEDPKNFHLKELEGAQERLTLYKADVLDYGSLCDAFRGCDGVFHTACSTSNERDQASIAVDGAENAINTAADEGVKRVVFTSTFGAAFMNPNRSPDAFVDENSWSDLDFCRKTNNWYCYGKTLAEQNAIQQAKRRGIDLVSILPHLTVGPMLQPTINTSILMVLKYVVGTKKSYPNAVAGYVDVRDVANAHILVHENPTTSFGRYICIGRIIHRSQFVQMLTEMFPEYHINPRCEDDVNPPVNPFMVANQRLVDLGLQYTPIEQSLYETVKCSQKKGHLPPPKCLALSNGIRSSL